MSELLAGGTTRQELLTSGGLRELVEGAHGNSVAHGWYEGGPGLEPVHGRPELPSFSVPEKLVLITSEVAEALEAYRDHGVRRRCEACNGHGTVDREAGDARQVVPCPSLCTDGFLASWVVPGAKDPTKPEGFVTELADVVIRVADLCGALGLDLGAAIVEKMRHNATRPHRHGGKRC